jgi:phage-related protein
MPSDCTKIDTMLRYGFLLGMPLVRKLKLWEVRSALPDRIARTLFTVNADYMVLLHGFIEKTQKTPPEDLELALKRLASLESESR